MTSYALSFIFNGFSMLVSVYFPSAFGAGWTSKIVFTINFIAFMLSFYQLVKAGVL